MATFRRELFIRFTVCSLCIFTFCNLVISDFDFVGGTLVLIASGLGHCLCGVHTKQDLLRVPRLTNRS